MNFSDGMLCARTDVFHLFFHHDWNSWLFGPAASSVHRVKPSSLSPRNSKFGDELSFQWVCQMWNSVERTLENCHVNDIESVIITGCIFDGRRPQSESAMSQFQALTPSLPDVIAHISNGFQRNEQDFRVYWEPNLIRSERLNNFSEQCWTLRYTAVKKLTESKGNNGWERILIHFNRKYFPS
jgi:hypothetical protein